MHSISSTVSVMPISLCNILPLKKVSFLAVTLKKSDLQSMLIFHYYKNERKIEIFLILKAPEKQ
jgi:hypothetical protein